MDDPVEAASTGESAPAPHRAGRRRYNPAHTSAGMLMMVVLSLMAIAGIGTAIAAYQEAQLISQLAGGELAGGSEDLELARSLTQSLADQAGTLQALAYTLIALAAILAIVFSFWVYKIYSNLPAMEVAEAKVRPGRATLYFWLPLANLVLGYLTLREIWKKSDVKPRTSGPVLLTVFWLLGIASAAMAIVSVYFSAVAQEGTGNVAMDSLTLSRVLLAGAAAIGAASNLLMLLFIYKSERRQIERGRFLLKAAYDTGA
jgi:hypothetical protein